MPYPWQPRVSLKHAPTLWAALHDNSPMRLIVGPLGSGKSTFCVADCLSRAFQQYPSPDGIRRFKLGIVRNTMPELRRTTIPTWLSIVPEEATAPLKTSTPAQHRIRIRASHDFKFLDDGSWQGSPGLDLQVEFFALDKPKDVRELLSWEGTMLWFNEVREIPKAIIDMAELRVGRYPSMAQGGVEPTWYGVLADTNPPDEDHWIYRADRGVNAAGEHIGRPAGWSFYRQAAAVIEMEQTGDGRWKSKKGQPADLLVFDERHIHQSAGTYWAVNPAAENLPNLTVHKGIDPTGDPLGPGSYYGRGLANKTRDWIESYFQARYRYVKEGKPVIGEFDPQTMVVDELPTMETPTNPMVGADIGGNTLNSAGVLFEHGPRGIWLVHNEVVGEDMGLDRFEGDLRRTWNATFGSERKCLALFGDPAGMTRDGIFETKAFEHMIAKGWPAQPAPSNAIKVRIDAIKIPMGRLIDGKPGVLIHRRCSRLIKALEGAWHYRQVQGSTDRYSEEPDKSHPYSDLGDAFGYGLSGAGETSQMTRGASGPVGVPMGGGLNNGVPFEADTSFDVFD